MIIRNVCLFKPLCDGLWMTCMQDAGAKALPPASSPPPLQAPPATAQGPVLATDPPTRDVPPANSSPAPFPSQPSPRSGPFGDSDDGDRAAPVTGESGSPPDSGKVGVDAGPIIGGVVGAVLLLLAGLAVLLFIRHKRRGATAATATKPPVRVVTLKTSNS